MKKFYYLLLVVLMSLSNNNSFCQAVSINPTGVPPNPSSILDVNSPTQGLLIPRMNKASKNGIASPATGLMVFQNGPDSSGFYYFDGSKWNLLLAAAGTDSVYWRVKGNIGLTDTTSFIGNKDSVPINFRINNQSVGRFNLGKFNYSIGRGAGNDLGAGTISIGDSAGASINNGIPGINIGYRSGMKSTGNSNTFLGGWSGENNTTGSFNVYTGLSSGQYNKTGGLNVGLGAYALQNDSVGTRNVAIGYSALGLMDSSAYNTAVGAFAGFYNKRDNLVSIGYAAGYYNNYLQTDKLQGLENVYMGNFAGFYANVGSGNTAIGNRALQGAGYYSANYPGLQQYKRNTVVGDSAAVFNYGNDNTVVGMLALSKNTIGNQHVAVGSRALLNTTATYPNTAVGYSSMDSMTTGSANTALGSYSLTKAQQGFNNVAIGNAAMYNAGSSNNLYNNTAVGNDALRFVRTNYQTAIGSGALRNDTAGYYNVAVGGLSMYNNLIGSTNTAVGISTLYSDSAGNSNTALGAYSLYTNKNGNNNTGVGMYSLFNHKRNDYNTAVGYESMVSDTTGGLNVAVGWRSLRFNTRGSENTAIGVGAIENDTIGIGNTAVGRAAMIGTKTGGFNTAIGYQAMGNADSSNYSTAIGQSAGYYNRRDNLVAIGNGAGYLNSYNQTDKSQGIENVYIGLYSGYYATVGSKNTAIGNKALQGGFFYSTDMPGLQQYKRNTIVGDSAAFNTYGNDNAALGFQSLVNNTTGNSNTAIGNYSMINNSTGNFNTVLGSNADVASNNLTNATAIGYRAQAGQSNSLILGSINGINGAFNSTNVGIGITTPSMPLTVYNTTSPTAINAGYFVSNNNTAYGSNGAALFAQNTFNGSSDVVAVMGKSLNASNGNGYGGYFQGNGTGVYGESSPGATGGFNTFGVYGKAAGSTGANNYGIYGFALNGATNYGVYGSASGGTSWAGYFNGAVFGTSYVTSDAKLKRNITGLDNAIEKVMQLKPMNYYYDVKKYPSMVLPEIQQTGFIAQDVEKIFPALVKEALQPAEYEHGDARGKKISDEVPFKALNYTGLIPVLTKAIQEQQGIINQQQEQINKQQKNIEDLLKRIEKLETR